MHFGIKTGQSGYTFDELASIWSKSEELNFESAWLHDHFIALSESTSDPCLEAYATLAALARETRNLRLGVMVTCVSYRNPALLAKIGATIDSISNGRFILGIGAGWLESEFKSYGFRFPPVAERLEQLKEALIILRLMWKENSPSFEGKHFKIHDASCYPKPVQSTLPIWVGISSGTKTLPRISIEQADGLNTTARPDLAEKIIARAEEIRNRTGRKRSEVTYSAQPSLLVGNESEISRIIADESKRLQVSSQDYLNRLKERGCIIGSPEKCAEELESFTKVGIEYLIPLIIGDRHLWPLEIIKDRLIPLL
jgi:alkanesulfonate monooxygenase SsuD/methylene tetrahydromethanopterin reductase-like flavin-dependent oxidoreductase (luciferase family)